jgi:hypothetical protein
MSDVNILAGTSPTAAENLVTADQETILGDGTALNPLRAVSSGGGGSLFPLESATPTSGDFNVVANRLNLVAGDVDANAQLPAASSVQNGGWVLIQCAELDARLNTLRASGDTIDFNNANLVNNAQDGSRAFLWLISDGVSNWTAMLLDPNEHFPD